MKIHFLNVAPQKGRQEVFFLPIPYEGTVSYMPGTRFGPARLLSASAQMETWDWELQWDPSQHLSFVTLDPLEVCVSGPEEMCERIYQRAKGLLSRQGFLFSLGGEHTITYPLIKAHGEKWPDIGVVQIDAHSDLRDTYEASALSHACVMRRVAELGFPILQLGIRSLCQEEWEYLQQNDQIHVLYGREVEHLSEGELQQLFRKTLPEKVYLTLDVDGLDPSVIPGTGTPEPGGLSWEGTLRILRTLAATKEIVGADLVELLPLGDTQLSEFVASKLVYKTLSYIFHQKR